MKEITEEQYFGEWAEYNIAERSNIITEQQLKARCTPDAIKWMVDLAEGFELEISDEIEIHFCGNWYTDEDIISNPMLFSILIRRAVDGWNEKKYTADRRADMYIRIDRARLFIFLDEMTTAYEFDNYKKENLTLVECACLHCLLDIFEEERK